MPKDYKSLLNLLVRLSRTDRTLDEIKINQGRLLALQLRTIQTGRLADYEFKVFSQSGEDGILQFLTSNLAIPNKTFIEFGVEDFSESNCRFLMMKDSWSGFVMDGSASNIRRLEATYYYWRHNLRARAAFVTRETVVSLLEESQFDKNVGILSVDIDGMDYHVLSELGRWTPCILIVEYNALFGLERAVTVPYSASFRRTKAHYSNLYYGASLRAFEHLARQRGYAFVGTNSTANNAFFVRRDLLNTQVREKPVLEAPPFAPFREGRDQKGRPTFSSPSDGRKAISELPLTDVITGTELRVADLGI